MKTLRFDGRASSVVIDVNEKCQWKVRLSDIIAEPLMLYEGNRPRREIISKIEDIMALVHLSPKDGDKFPHQFSGGQRQRISIARALTMNPDFLICDEPTSALDVSIQAQILNLMKELQEKLGLTYLFISHNLAVVSFMSDQVGVMYLGRLVEVAKADELFGDPAHPYTKLLLATVPSLNPGSRENPTLVGEVPSATAPPPGCSFHPRCPLANSRCKIERPQLKKQSINAKQVACHAVEEGRISA